VCLRSMIRKHLRLPDHGFCCYMLQRAICGRCTIKAWGLCRAWRWDLQRDLSCIVEPSSLPGFSVLGRYSFSRISPGMSTGNGVL